MLTEDAQADPPLPSRRSRLVHCLVKLLISFVEMHNRILSFSVDMLYGGFLLDDRGFHVLEQLSELNHLSLNLLDGFMPTLDGTQCGLRLTSAVLCEELGIVSGMYREAGE